MELKTLCNYLFCFIFCSAYHLANETTIIIIIIIIINHFLLLKMLELESPN